MHAATEVGGDYYDVVPVDDGCWLGIGDVAGHGLGTGLVMLMMQSGIGALARKMPDAAPRDLLLALNTMLVENVRDAPRPARTRDADAAPLPPRRQPDLRGRARGDAGPPRRDRPLRADRDAGRLGGRQARHHRRAPSTAAARLQPGDLLVLYTDGLTEAAAADGSGARFGIDRLIALVEEHGASPPAAVRDAILAAVAAFSARATTTSRCWSRATPVA